MYSQYCVLNNFRFRNFGQILGAIRRNIQQTFRHNSAPYCRIVPNIRHNSALFGTFRRFSEIISASILLVGNQTAWHVLLGFWIAIGYLTVSTSNTHQILLMFCRIVPNIGQYWALFGTFRQLFGTFRRQTYLCVCVLLVDDS